MQKINFRNEIIGLRAIAIIAVIFFHLGNQYFDGGFVGVDIFFVISGYLISSIIFNNINNFNIFYFYERRIRRIVPVLLVVSLVTVPFAYFTLLQKNFTDYGQSLTLVPVFLSNFIFWIEEGYWEFSSKLKPLIHTWSLAVEGQFYLFYPLIFFFKNKKNILILVFIFWLISFLISINDNSEFFTITTDKVLSFGNFYLPFSRFWEFASGAIILFLNKKIKFTNYLLNNFLSIMGLGLIIYSVFFIKYTSDYPNFYAIFPVIGTCFLITYSEKNFFIYKALSSKILVHLGEISYSLYLWHVPLIIFHKYFFNLETNIYHDAALVLLTYVFSLITYKYIEVPFYKNNLLKTKNFLISILVFSILVISIGLWISKSESKTSYIEKKITILKKQFSSYEYYFEDRKKIDDIQLNFSEDIKKRKILILGDSHGRDLTRVLKRYNYYKKSIDLKILNDFSFSELSNLKIIINSPLYKKIKSSDMVLLSRQFTSDKGQFKEIIKLIEFLKKDGVRFALVGSAPEFYTAEDDLLFTFILHKSKNLEYLKNKNFLKVNNYFYLNLKNYLFNTNKKLKNISKKYRIPFLDRFDFTCDVGKKICDGISNDGKKLFMDYSHFTSEGIDYFAKKIYELNWLSKINY